jgi:methylase of polypeptide subunit release factors
MTIHAATFTDATDHALLAVLRFLDSRAYQFTTPTPATHRRILLRRGRVEARSLIDVFGWNLPFQPRVVGPELLELMTDAGMLERRGQALQSRLRVASVGPQLFLHSAFPPHHETVFFGPDSYRFADFIRLEAGPQRPGGLIIDIGAGAGVGGLTASRLSPDSRLVLSDRNPQALRLAKINAAFAGVDATFKLAEGLPELDAAPSLVVANPPYIAGGGEPIYSGGGGQRGEALSLQWAQAAATRLAPGGRLLLYTGSPIERDRDPLRDALTELCPETGCTMAYREIDADVFPGLLLRRAYWSAERVAAVGAVITKPA